MSEQERMVIFGMTRDGKRQRMERLMREQTIVQRGKCMKPRCGNWRYYRCQECGAAICRRHASVGRVLASSVECPLCHAPESKLKIAPAHAKRYRRNREAEYLILPQEVSADCIEQNLRRAQKGLSKLNRRGGDIFV